jgi:hypothetical protein
MWFNRCYIRSTSQYQWDQISKRHRAAEGIKFPGYLCSEDLLLLMAKLGLRLSPIECRELLLIIAPERNGKVYQTDFHTFSLNSSRMIGEMEALLERDLLKPLLTAYNDHKQYYRENGLFDHDLKEKYDRVVKDIVRQVQGARIMTIVNNDPNHPVTNDIALASKSGANHEIVAIQQLKTGVETAMR